MRLAKSRRKYMEILRQLTHLQEFSYVFLFSRLKLVRVICI